MHMCGGIAACSERLRELSSLLMGHCLQQVGIVRECPLRDIRLLVRQMMQRMALAPLVHFIVLIDVAGLGTRNAIEGSDGSTSEARQCTEDCTLLLSDLSTLELVNHLI